MAGLGRNKHDAMMKRHLRDAERALRQAADLCAHVVRFNQKEGVDRSEIRPALALQRELAQILGKMGSLGRIAPMNFDPDARVEEEKTRIQRELLAKRRSEKAAQTRVTNGSED